MSLTVQILLATICVLCILAAGGIAGKARAEREEPDDAGDTHIGLKLKLRGFASMDPQREREVACERRRIRAMSAPLKPSYDSHHHQADPSPRA